MKKKLVFVLFTSVTACLSLYFVERILYVSYEMKTLCKLVLFTVIPVCYLFLFQDRSQKEKRKSFWLSVILSVTTFSVIWVGYFLFSNFIDFHTIRNELNLTEREFVFRGIYIILGNSFLEEYFFRGFIFFNLYKAGFRKIAQLYSSLLFAVYHIALFQTWFPLPVMLLALFALFAVGFMFNHLVLRVSSFTGSWIVHATSDLAIILIGWYALYS